ncbi:tetratricopeptide repeat protein [Streptomyces niveus]|uniref:tetratricopeptide repeat protein n=1 Tax=Streptomyces niveus TaxID=193462 RepID=UPI0036C6E866
MVVAVIGISGLLLAEAPPGAGVVGGHRAAVIAGLRQPDGMLHGGSAFRARCGLRLSPTRHLPQDLEPASLEAPAMAINDTALDAGYRSLPPRAKTLYRQLAVLPTTRIDVHGAAAASALSPLTAGKALMAMCEARLLEEAGGRFGFAAGARGHALHLAVIHDSESGRRGTLRRLCDWVLYIATRAQEQLMPAQDIRPRVYHYQLDGPPPFASGHGALAWLREGQNDLLAIVRAAADARWYHTAWQLVDAHWPLFVYAHPYGLWIETHRIGLDCARRAGDNTAVRRMLNSGAIGLCNAQEFEEAIEWYTAGLVAARRQHDVRGEGDAHLGLARCHLQAGSPVPAEVHVLRAIECQESCDDSLGVALAQLSYGEIVIAQNNPTRAVGLLSDAHRCLSAGGDPFDTARALALRGWAHALGGDHEAALRDLHKALRVFDEAGSERWQARARHLLGKTYAASGHTDRARVHLQDAAELYQHVDPTHAATVRNTLQTL